MNEITEENIIIVFLGESSISTESSPVLAYVIPFSFPGLHGLTNIHGLCSDITGLPKK